MITKIVSMQRRWFCRTHSRRSVQEAGYTSTLSNPVRVLYTGGYRLQRAGVTSVEDLIKYLTQQQTS